MERRNHQPQTFHGQFGCKTTGQDLRELSTRRRLVRSRWWHRIQTLQIHKSPAWSLIPRARKGQRTQKPGLRILSKYYGKKAIFILFWPDMPQRRTQLPLQKTKTNIMSKVHVVTPPSKVLRVPGLSKGPRRLWNLYNRLQNEIYSDCSSLSTTSSLVVYLVIRYLFILNINY